MELAPEEAVKANPNWTVSIALRVMESLIVRD
jgi:hypothetical protein